VRIFILFGQTDPIFAQQEHRVGQSDTSGDPKGEAQPEVPRDDRDDEKREASNYDGYDVGSWNTVTSHADIVGAIGLYRNRPWQ
jgi:hypothetical protein